MSPVPVAPGGGPDEQATSGNAPEFASGEAAQILGQILGGGGEGKGERGPTDPTVAAGKRAYFQIWGVKPPRGYIEQLVRQGLNVYEIIEHELSKPQARRTNYYRDRYAEFAEVAARIMGMRP